MKHLKMHMRASKTYHCLESKFFSSLKSFEFFFRR